MSKKIIVTGGAGFLGSHLIERLLQKGHFVTCVDNFYTGSTENLSSFQNHPHFSLVKHDISYPIQLEADEIYNLACPASPIHYQSDPIQTIKTNVLGAINVLDLAQKNSARVLQASTSEVYGDPLIHPQTEDYWGNVNPTGIRACYDEGKRCAETLFFNYARQYGVDIRVARIFNTYGPRMHPNDGRVVSNFIVQALANLPITLYGTGSQTRSFCYVSDLIEGLIRLMEFQGPVPSPVNLGNPREMSVRHLAEKILSLAHSSSPLIHHPLPSDDPTRRQPDITLAKTLLQWEPQVDLEEGLKKTLSYFQNSLYNAPHETSTCYR